VSSVFARVVNTDHDNTTLSVLEEIPDITYTFKRSDIGSSSWSVPLSHPNLQRLSSTGPSGFGPKLTDYRIGISRDSGVTWETVHGGFCGPVGLESDRSTVAVAGADWTLWLAQPFPFGAYNSDGRTVNDVVKFWVMENQQTIITDLVTARPEVAITTSYEGAGWGVIPTADIILGDNTTMLDHIKQIGDYNDPYGFEFWMDWDKTMYFAAPRRAPHATAVAIEKFAPSLENLVKASWGNTGPKAVSTIGEIMELRSFSTYEPSVAVYRDWWNFVNFNGLKMNQITDFQATLAQRTAYVGEHDRNPQKTLTIVIRPEDAVQDFFHNRVGEVIEVDTEDWWLPYHRVNALFWIDTQTLANDNVGNWTCTLTLEQIYGAEPVTV
jgi:hypothetical protein